MDQFAFCLFYRLGGLWYLLFLGTGVLRRKADETGIMGSDDTAGHGWTQPRRWVAQGQCVN